MNVRRHSANYTFNNFFANGMKLLETSCHGLKAAAAYCPVLGDIIS